MNKLLYAVLSWVFALLTKVAQPKWEESQREAVATFRFAGFELEQADLYAYGCIMQYSLRRAGQNKSILFAHDLDRNSTWAQEIGYFRARLYWRIWVPIQTSILTAYYTWKFRLFVWISEDPKIATIVRSYMED